MKRDFVSVVEAAYRVQQDEAAWIQGIMEAAQPLLDTGLGVYSYVFDASDPARLGLRSFSHAGQPADFSVAEMMGALAGTPKEYVVRSWRARACGLASEVEGFHGLESVKTYFRPRGIADILAISGVDPTGHGTYVGAGLPRLGKLDSRQRAIWSRIAAHLAASFRLRRALANAADPTLEAEAILSPSGKVAHAVGVASEPRARAALKDAVVHMDRARTKARRAEADAPLEEWRGLVAARWSLLEHFEHDGRRYLVARKNDPDAAGPDSLTRRERQVLGYLALGHSNKLVAYELGISASTVGVLLLRAARKLRVGSRAGAIAAWRAFGEEPLV